MDVESQLRRLGSDERAGVAGRALGGEDAAEILEWHHHPIAYANVGPDTRALYRVTGMAARPGGTPEPWSAVLKVFRAPAGSAAAESGDEHYYRREALAYRSGLLDMPAARLVVPKLLGVTEYPPDTVWLWLEDVSEAASGAPWPVARYALAARHLGAFNGAYLARSELPAYPWLARRALRSWVAEHEPLIGLIERPEVWRYPLMRRAFPVPVAERVRRVWAEREAWYAALDRLPQTLCHHDAWHANLFARQAEDGRELTVAIDWELVGTGVVGGDVGNLVAVSMIDLALEADRAHELEGAALAAYLEGLTEAGWRGDPRAVRLGYAATACLRHLPATIGWPAAIVLDDSGRHAAETEQRWARPLPDIFEQWAAVTSFLLELADEARSSLDAA